MSLTTLPILPLEVITSYFDFSSLVIFIIIMVIIITITITLPILPLLKVIVSYLDFSSQNSKKRFSSGHPNVYWRSVFLDIQYCIMVKQKSAKKYHVEFANLCKKNQCWQFWRKLSPTLNWLLDYVHSVCTFPSNGLA